MKQLIGKVKIKIFSLPFKNLTDKTEILGERNLANEFINFFKDIGLKLSTKISESSQHFESYMNNVSSEMENKPLSISELKDTFYFMMGTLQVMMILLIMLLVNVLESYVTR